jgi:hypothetical protein
MEFKMTNDTKPSAREIKFWEGVKQNILDRADTVSHFDDDEHEALKVLRWAGLSIHEEFSNLTGDVAHDDLVDFCRYSDVLCEEYGWNTSENDAKREIGVRLCELAIALREDAGDGPRLPHRQAKYFGSIYPLINDLLHTKPNKYQMERFAEHGITWEGEVDEH